MSPDPQDSPADGDRPADAPAVTDLADAGPVPEVGTVLVPVDTGDAAPVAADHAAALAARYGASVHALYVQDPERLWALRNGRAEASELAADSRSVLDTVRAACRARGVGVRSSTALGFSTARLSRHPGEVVLDAAESVGADILVVPRVRGADRSGVLGRVAEYVVAYASQPVLSV